MLTEVEMTLQRNLGKKTAMEDEPTVSANEWLAAEDDASRASRSPRLDFVIHAYGVPRHILIPGGFVPSRALEEAKWCFVNGQFLACILVCQVMLEGVLAGQYGLIGNDKAKEDGFKRLCDKGLAEGLISSLEHEAFTVLRQLRNSYTHPRNMDDPERIERRMMTEQRAVEEILEEDARHALLAALRLTQRYPFGFEDDAEPSAGGDGVPAASEP